jgi:membrane-bound lytic murein transglycosylase MltF
MTRARAVAIGAIVCAGLALAGCGPTEPGAPADPPAAAPALIDIPVTPGRAAGGDVDMRLIEPFSGDLNEMAERGAIRVLVAPSRTHFQTVDGSHRGRTVDAVTAFERFVNERIAPRHVGVMLIEAAEASLIADLLAGRGDIAANVLRTFERDDQVAFATPVRTGIREVVVLGPGAAPLVSLEDVGGRIIHARRHSDHHASLIRLNDQLRQIDRPPATIVTTPESHTDEDLLEAVNAGRIPATLADDYIYDAWRAAFDKTSTSRDISVSQDGELAWVTRKESTELLALVNQFFATHRLVF